MSERKEREGLEQTGPRVGGDNATRPYIGNNNKTIMEAIQELILTTLDSSGKIDDSRNITLPGESSPATSQDAQLQILRALNSLASREVSHTPPFNLSNYM